MLDAIAGLSEVFCSAPVGYSSLFDHSCDNLLTFAVFRLVEFRTKEACKHALAKLNKTMLDGR